MVIDQYKVETGIGIIVIDAIAKLKKMARFAGNGGIAKQKIRIDGDLYEVSIRRIEG